MFRSKPTSSTPTTASMSTTSFVAEDASSTISSLTHLLVDREEALSRLYKGVEVKNRKYHLRTYKKCFVASEVVDYMVSSGWAKSRTEAVEIGQQLQQEYNLFEHVVDPQRHVFKDEFLFFRFNLTSGRTSIMHTNAGGGGGSSFSGGSFRNSGMIGLDSFSIAESTTSSNSGGHSNSNNNNNNNNNNSNHKNTNTRVDYAECSHKPSSFTSRLSTIGQSKSMRVSTFTFASLGLLAVGELLKENVTMKYNFALDCECFVAIEAVDFLVSTGIASSRQDAVRIGLGLEKVNRIRNVKQDGFVFADVKLYYGFVNHGDDPEKTNDDDDDDNNSTYEDALNDFYNDDASDNDNDNNNTDDDDDIDIHFKNWRERLHHAKTLVENNLKISNLTYRLKTYKDSFKGTDAVDFILLSGITDCRVDAVLVGRALVYEYNLFQHVTNDHEFEDEDYFYRFSNVTRISSRLEEAVENSSEFFVDGTKEFDQGDKSSTDDFSSDLEHQSQQLRRSSVTSNTTSSSGMGYTTKAMGLVSIQEILRENIPKYYIASMDRQGFTSVEAIDLMVSTGLASSRHDAVHIGKAMNELCGCIENLHNDGKPFSDSPKVYFAFTHDDEAEHENWRDELESLRTWFRNTIKTSDLMYHLKTYKDSFTGSSAVDLLVRAGKTPCRNDAVLLGRALQFEFGSFHHVTNGHVFEDNSYFYRLQTSKSRISLLR